MKSGRAGIVGSVHYFRDWLRALMMTSPPSSLSPAGENAPTHPGVAGAPQVARFGCSPRHNIWKDCGSVFLSPVFSQLQTVWIECPRSWVTNSVCLGPTRHWAHKAVGPGARRPSCAAAQNKFPTGGLCHSLLSDIIIRHHCRLSFSR